MLAAIALLWPDRIGGPFDGVPLDRAAEAILVGAVFPALWWFNPHFLRTHAARVLIVLLIAWRIVAATLFVQEGWCVRFAPAVRPYAKDAVGAPHAWDLRADWRAADPACSAIMTRPYERFADFPAWFFNLPPAADGMPRKEDRPPGATTAMTVQGFVTVADEGLLRVDVGPDVTSTIRVDGGSETGEARLAPGVHTVNISATLSGDRWQFAPVFNGRSMFTTAVPTVRRPSRADIVIRPWVRVIPVMLAQVLLAAWAISAVLWIADPVLLPWATIASAVLGWLAAGRIEDGRWAIAALACAAILPLRRRIRNLRGAFVAIGVPWLVFVIVVSRPEIGRFTLYSAGDDWWTFERFAYRITMQGYWLEGGSATFWFQPLYRWIAALLHIVFVDSSVGEWYWDAACLVAGSLFAFRVVRACSGFRWGLIAGVAPLALFARSHEWVYLGRGLAEISSAGLLYVAALFTMRSRHRRAGFAAIGGSIATLGFYTRLNNAPMAIGTAVFALSPRVATEDAFRPWTWPRRASWRSALMVWAAFGIGLVLFAWRTWYYTGVFSVLYGTAGGQLAVWVPGLPIGTFLQRAADSVMMVLTLNDPARYDPYALPVLGGAAVAVLSVLGVPRLRTLPLPLVLFFFSTVAGALVARGTA